MVIKEKFKQTEIGMLPKEWEVIRLENVIEELKNGFASGKRDDNGIVQVRMNNVTTDGKLVFDSFIKVPIPTNIDDFILREKDFLFNNTNSYDLVGKSTIFKETPYPCSFSNHFTRIRFKESVLPEWVLFHFISLWRKGYFKSVAIRHVGQSAVQAKFIKKLLIPLPPLPEQTKIAEILTAVDEAIQTVDKAIGKTDRLKKGLMQELLTKGIGHKEFMETEIGRIPKEWEVEKLDEMTEINKDSREPIKDLPDYKFLYIDIDSIANETGFIKGAKEILGKNAPSRARRLIHYNDVIMSTVRPYLKAFAIVPKEYDKQICSTGFAVMTCNKEKILPLYLLYTLFSKVIIDQCNKMMVGAQYPALNTSQVKKLKLPLPSIPEQQKISEILSTVDNKLEFLRDRKRGFERIKYGLMNDLLTGRRRVKVEG